MKIFLTGSTGFLGYHIANDAIARGHEILSLKRATSRSLFDPAIEKRVKWVEINKNGWEEAVKDFQPDLFIHSAWGGVTAADRNNKEVQSENVRFFSHLLNLYPYKRIIGLGSQDEYGHYNGCIEENHPINPISEYGKAKNECRLLLEDYPQSHLCEWQWIRIFSVYGEKQRSDWLIPTIISKCLNGEIVMQTTKGEQVYSYLFALDFANAIMSIIGKENCSGIYNLASSVPVVLSDLFDAIKEITKSNIEFSKTLPYREGQSMVMLGNSSKFISTFGEFERTGLKEGLQRLIINTKKDESI
ncbi:MAG: NAD(P)-dependent oxidoreductase [Bacteroidales bacterium]|nr:NAD(P)-dependent oxidoreductase [Bacteroidales bacterium]